MPSEKITKLIKMLYDPDHQMRAILKLEALGSEAKPAVPDLWIAVNDLDGEPGPRVRAAALRAIAVIDGPSRETIDGLLGKLEDPITDVVLQAAQSLGNFGPSIKHDCRKLVDKLITVWDPGIRATLARAIIQITDNDDELYEQALADLKLPSVQTVATTIILSELDLSSAKAGRALKGLWEALRQNNLPFYIAEPVLLAIINITADDDTVLENLLSDTQLSIQTRAFAITDPRLKNNVSKAFKASNDRSLLEALLSSIREEGRGKDGKDDIFIIRDVLTLLMKGQFDEGNLKKVLEAVKDCVNRTGYGLAFLYEHEPAAVNVYLKDHTTTPLSPVGAFLLETPGSIRDEQWINEPAAIIRHTVAMLTDPAYFYTRELKDWGIYCLETNSERISWEVCEQVIDQLKQQIEKANPESFDDYYAKRALDVFQSRHDKLDEDRLLHVIRDDQNEYEARIQKIKQLLQADQTDPVRGLVEVWTQWLVNPEKSALVDATADILRNSPSVILPLVDRLNKNYQSGEKTTKEEQENLGLIRYRRIARQLADMSDPRFFGGDGRHVRIQDELRKHAIPALARRLRDETDLEARESLARALANLGGREAVDAVVRAVVDEEKKRTARQDLLAEYYLNPSRKQSDEAAKILSRAVEDARNTLRLLKTLNTAFFGVGVTVLLVGIFTSLFNAESGTRLTGALTGLGGLAGVLAQLIFNPLDRIQKAMTDLVQLETAFMSFIWELNLNGTYIQSQYVAEGILTDEEIGKTINRIESAMNLTMSLVSTHTGSAKPSAEKPNA